MRNIASFPVLSAVVALALLAGCSGSGNSALAPKPASPNNHAQILTDPVRNSQPLVGYNSCPASGQIEYASDTLHDVIDVYAGNFAGQPPCGRITSGLSNPIGLHVDAATHDLYVANSSDSNILVFHRGQTASYNTYFDHTGHQGPLDVTLTNDGTLIASNSGQLTGPELGSISTWIAGPNGGTFVGNFPMTNDAQGGFIAVRSNGTVYYNDLDSTSNRGALWSLTCPAGACGTQTQVTGVSFPDPAGMAIDSTGDLFVTDRTGMGQTFELPNPHPKTFPLLGFPYGLAINRSGHHIFIADWSGPKVQEYAYPSGTFIGAVKGAQYGWLRGVAVDQ
jgi:DNA-binding beta-propeller fold protein YncE